MRGSSPFLTEFCSPFSQETGTPAVISQTYGAGRALLSGLHFEFDPTNLPEFDGDPFSERILPSLVENNPGRVQLCSSLLRDLVADKSES